MLRVILKNLFNFFQNRLLSLRQVIIKEVERDIDRHRNDTSTCVDRILVKFVKLARQDIAGLLGHIINTCVRNSYFRPVSILPTISKVFERFVLSRLVDYINEQAFFYF